MTPRLTLARDLLDAGRGKGKGRGTGLQFRKKSNKGSQPECIEDLSNHAMGMLWKIAGMDAIGIF